MQKKKRQSGVTLTELIVVVAVMAILMSISVPTAKKLMNSFDSSTGARQLINAALSNARAIAVREQAYAGVRFQKKEGEEDGVTYMVLIVHDYEATGDAEGYRAVTGRTPMPLPEDVTVTQASVVFTPAGRLTVRDVQCLQASSNDTIFNSDTSVDAMFEEDGASQESVRKLNLSVGDNAKQDEYISPYTGELILEYK